MLEVQPSRKQAVENACMAITCMLTDG